MAEEFVKCTSMAAFGFKGLVLGIWFEISRENATLHYNIDFEVKNIKNNRQKKTEVSVDLSLENDICLSNVLFSQIKRKQDPTQTSQP